MKTNETSTSIPTSREEKSVIKSDTACWTKVYDSWYKMVTSTYSTLPPAVYRTSTNSNGEVILEPVKQNSDDVFELPGLPIEEVNERIEKFWAKEEVYENFNFVHKTGIIFHGPPGNGKTCVITSLVKRLLAKGGIVISVSEFSQASQALRTIRQVEPKRRIMTLIEDMDTLLSGENKQQEQSALSMLDGQDQVSGIVHIATTNHPELLADRFIKRPGRFDMVIGMDVPSTITRRGYFQRILRNEAHPQLEYLVSKTEGMALAHLREIATSYLCLGIPVDETIARLHVSVNTTFKPTKAYGRGENLGFQVGCIKTTEECAEGQ